MPRARRSARRTSRRTSRRPGGNPPQLVAGLPSALHAGHPEWEVAELLAEPGAVPLDAGREAGLAELRAIEIRTID